jgi:hypothetical protein
MGSTACTVCMPLQATLIRMNRFVCSRPARSQDAQIMRLCVPSQPMFLAADCTGADGGQHQAPRRVHRRILRSECACALFWDRVWNFRR